MSIIMLAVESRLLPREYIFLYQPKLAPQPHAEVIRHVLTTCATRARRVCPAGELLPASDATPTPLVNVSPRTADT